MLQLCETHDVVCLQEHWLLPNELDMLSDIHIDIVLLIYLQLF